MTSRLGTLLIILFVVASAFLTGDQRTRNRIVQSFMSWVDYTLNTPAELLDGGILDLGISERADSGEARTDRASGSSP